MLWQFGQQMRYVAETLAPHWLEAARLMLNAEDNVLAFIAFPRAHWTRIYSTNVLERLNKEVKRHIKVVEIFPDIPSVIRLVGALLAEANDEWQIHRCYFSKELMRQLDDQISARC